MRQTLVIIALAVVLVISGCGTPKATIGTPSPVPPPPTPLVVDLSKGTYTITEYQQSVTGVLTLNLVHGTCPPVAPGTTFFSKSCYQAASSWPGSMTVTGAGCTEILGVGVGQDANNNLQIAVTGNPLAGTYADYTYYAVGSITSQTASSGTWELSCGGALVSGQWFGIFQAN